MIFGFIHICTIGHWNNIIDEQIRIMKVSGLMSELNNVYCGVVGPEDYVPDHPKVEIVYRSANIREFEFSTLSKLHDFCKGNHRDSVFYIHSKGVSHRKDTSDSAYNMHMNIQDHRRYMEYVLLYRYKRCLKALEVADACGTDFRKAGSGLPPYFAGNFWWAKASYIAGLPPPIRGRFRDPNRDRAEAEFWIGRGEGIMASMWNGRANPYAGRYPRRMFVGMDQPIRFFYVKNLRSYKMALEA